MPTPSPPERNQQDGTHTSVRRYTMNVTTARRMDAIWAMIVPLKTNRVLQIKPKCIADGWTRKEFEPKAVIHRLAFRRRSKNPDLIAQALCYAEWGQRERGANPTTAKFR